MRDLLHLSLAIVFFAGFTLNTSAQVIIGTGNGPTGPGSGNPFSNPFSGLPSTMSFDTTSNTLIVNAASSLPGALVINGPGLLFHIDTSTLSAATLSLNGGLDLLVNTPLTIVDDAASPVTLAGGTTFTLVHYVNSESGQFVINGSVIAEGGTFSLGNNQFVLNYAYGDPDVEITVAPEPSTWMLTLASVGLLVWWRRFSRKII